MKHPLSDHEKVWRSRPLSHMGGLPVIVVCALLLPVSLWQVWQLSPSTGQLTGFVMLAPIAAVLAFLAIIVRRQLRPPKATLDSTFLDVTVGGIWREVDGVRTLMVAAADITGVRVVRDKFKCVRSVILATAKKELMIHGLADMQAFIDDVRSTFARLEIVEVQ